MIAPCAEQSWLLAKWSAAGGFVAGGWAVGHMGFGAFSPPPPPPGTALCGNAVLGGLVLMFVGAPLAAITSSLVAGVVGGVLDCILYHLRPTRLDSEPKT